MKCPKSGPWAVAQQLGQLPLWIHEPIWAAAYLLCMILAAIGESGQYGRGVEEGGMGKQDTRRTRRAPPYMLPGESL